jgi:hypothetical protein
MARPDARRILAAAALSASLLVAGGPAGAGGAVPACHPNFSSVATPDLGTAGELVGVVSISARDAWAVGNVDEEAASLREHWDGRAWTVVPGPDPGVSSALEAVDATSSTDVWAVGATNDGVSDASLIEHWDGGQWTVSPNPGNKGLLAVAALSPTDVWVAGEAQLVMHYDGTGWNVVAHPPLEEGDLRSASALGPNDVWFAGGMESEAGGEVALTMHWDGALLGVVPPVVPDVEGSEFRSIVALSPTDVWAVGEQENPPLARVLIQHWDGIAWSVVEGPNPSDEENELHGISALSSTDIYAVGVYAVDEVEHPLAMHWNGSRWRTMGADEPVPGDGITVLNAISARTARDIWAVGAHGDYPDLAPLVENVRGCR